MVLNRWQVSWKARVQTIWYSATAAIHYSTYCPAMVKRGCIYCLHTRSLCLCQLDPGDKYRTSLAVVAGRNHREPRNRLTWNTDRKREKKDWNWYCKEIDQPHATAQIWDKVVSTTTVNVRKQQLWNMVVVARSRCNYRLTDKRTVF